MDNKFSRKIFADEDAYYMSCPEVVGTHLAEQLSKYKSAIELCCAVGMTAIQLAKKLDLVTAVDISENRIKDARKNARVYGVEDKINFIVGDVLDENMLEKQKADVAILDPDWSAEGDEKSLHVDSIDGTQPNMRQMYNLTKKYITPNIVIRVPKNFTFETLEDFGVCKIENVSWGGKLRFKLAYFSENMTNNSETDLAFD